MYEAGDVIYSDALIRRDEISAMVRKVILTVQCAQEIKV
jgi:hypothetical protein